MRRHASAPTPPRRAAGPRTETFRGGSEGYDKRRHAATRSTCTPLTWAKRLRMRCQTRARPQGKDTPTQARRPSSGPSRPGALDARHPGAPGAAGSGRWEGPAARAAPDLRTCRYIVFLRVNRFCGFCGWPIGLVRAVARVRVAGGGPGRSMGLVARRTAARWPVARLGRPGALGAFLAQL